VLKRKDYFFNTDFHKCNSFSQISLKVACENVRKIVLLRLDSILMGVLFAWVSYYYTEQFNKHKNGMLLLAIGLLIGSFYHYYADSLHIGEVTSFFSKTFYFSLTSLGFAFCLPYANNSGKVNVLTSRWQKFVVLISMISYSIYLTHYSLVIWFLNKYAHLNTTVFFMLYLLCSVLGSIYSFFNSLV